MTKYLIGTGGWAYFQVPGQHPLVAYAKAFDFVEVNSTFYEMPSLRLVQSWRTLVPPNFEFAVRCNQALTHQQKLQPTPEAYTILNQMTQICHTLNANILHLQTPPSFKLTKPNIDRIDNFFSSADLKGIRIALEIRGADKSLDPQLIKTMQTHNMIHCVDLSTGQKPSYQSDILYSRLFGPGQHNIYQPTDAELKRIDRKASKGDHKTVAMSFHFVRMYKDAARLKTYKQTGKFPMVTKSTGQQSLIEVLREDAQFPTTKAELIDHQGWKLIDLTPNERVHAAHLLQTLPEKTYNNLRQVVHALSANRAR